MIFFPLVVGLIHIWNHLYNSVAMNPVFMKVIMFRCYTEALIQLHDACVRIMYRIIQRGVMLFNLSSMI